eukprot:TRINITY_DN5340_c0_g2_i1.p1 TRINITY_DN5340_c0_g2~~TRINITY_DN5340_c0_g2_i1.p1  ORF type:complete len:701 (-),score=96.91 TRINITY_DN5340_c0_g2_i1:433-2535(-)
MDNGEFATAKTSVWWDLESCPVPDRVDPYCLAQNISSALAEFDYKGRLSITAFADSHKLPEKVQRALSNTGIALHHVPTGVKDAKDMKILVDMLFWAVDNSAPANYLVISGDHDFANALHQLSMRRYNILIAYPSKDVPQSLSRAAKHNWYWETLASGVQLTNSIKDSKHVDKYAGSKFCLNDAHKGSVDINSKGKSLSGNADFQLAAFQGGTGELKQSIYHSNIMQYDSNMLSSSLSVPPSISSSSNRTHTPSGLDSAYATGLETIAHNGRGSYDNPLNTPAFHDTQGSFINSSSIPCQTVMPLGSDGLRAQGRPNLSPKKKFSPLSIPNGRPILRPNQSPHLNLHLQMENHIPMHNDPSHCVSNIAQENCNFQGECYPKGHPPRGPNFAPVSSNYSQLNPNTHMCVPNNNVLGVVHDSLNVKRSLCHSASQMTSPNTHGNPAYYTHGTSQGKPESLHAGFNASLPQIPVADFDRLNLSPNLKVGSANSSLFLPPKQCSSSLDISKTNNQNKPLRNGEKAHMSEVESPGHPLLYMVNMKILKGAIESLKENMIPSTEQNLEDCIKYGHMHVPCFKLRESLEQAVSRNDIKVRTTGSKFKMYVLSENPELWRCIDPLSTYDNYPKKWWKRLSEFLSSSEGQSLITESQNRYHAAEFLRRNCLQSLKLGHIIHMLQLSISPRQWLKPSPSGWVPLTVTLAQ